MTDLGFLLIGVVIGVACCMLTGQLGGRRSLARARKAEPPPAVSVDETADETTMANAVAKGHVSRWAYSRRP